MQQFHPAVRNSPEVKFAVQAFAALNSNNFVRFFKLVQSASYLNACLLHCYFNQVSTVTVLEGKGHALGNTLLVQMREVSSLDCSTIIFHGNKEARKQTTCTDL